MFKLLAILTIALAAGVGVTAAAIAFENTGATAVAANTAPQHLTMQVLGDNDRMLGPELVVHPGPVTLTIVNRARHSHLFRVPALGIQHVVLPGSASAPSSTTVRFTVPLGVFHWFCAFPCNKPMSGDIYVVRHPPSIHGALWASA